MRASRAAALALLIAPLVPLLPPEAVAADLGGSPGRSRIARPEPIPVTPQAIPYSWSGLYFGAHGGYGWSDVDWQQDGGPSASRGGDGWLAGGQVGVNLQAGRLVYGVEADISAAWIDGGNGDCCGHSIDRLYSVRGRAGLTSYDNRWLFYATGGAAWADIDYRSAGLGGHSETQFGWVAGGGVERALSSNLTARVEYLYYDFDSASAPAGTLAGGATDLDPSMQTVRFGLNYRF